MISIILYSPTFGGPGIRRSEIGGPIRVVLLRRDEPYNMIIVINTAATHDPIRSIPKGSLA